MKDEISPENLAKMRLAFEAIRRGDYAERDRLIAEMKAETLASNINAFQGNGQPIRVPGKLVRDANGVYRGVWG